MESKIINGNCLEELKKLDANSVDAVITDPPYGISFMNKAWDYDVPTADVWKECLRVLKPGGHLLSFASPRTYHRIAINIEDAGFEIRDQVMWIYGSGFPKSLDVSKQIDKKKKATRKVIGTKKGVVVDDNQGYGGIARGGFGIVQKPGDIPVTEPATEEAKKYNGWGTALKPAHEPIVVARKPIEGTVAENVLQYGVGGINVDGCRIPSAQDDKYDIRRYDTYHKTFSSYAGTDEEQTFSVNEKNELGRWPANIMFDEEAAKVLDEQVDNTSRFFYVAKTNKKDRNEGGATNNHPTVKPTELMRYLVRMITPKNGIVLDPFMGSGSTGKAAILEGMRFIGIEKEKEYCKIAKQRVKHEEDKNKFWE